jgi:hypothetical protein
LLCKHLQVQITDVHDVLSPQAGARSRQLQQLPGFRTVLPVAEVSFLVRNVSSTAAGAAAAAQALDEAIAGAQKRLGTDIALLCAWRTQC